MSERKNKDAQQLKSGSVACQFMWPTIRDQLESSEEPVLFWQGFYAQMIAYTQMSIGKDAIPAIANVIKAVHVDNESEKETAAKRGH